MTPEEENAEVDALAHQQLILVAGIMAGMSFAALVLVLQSPAEFDKPTWGLLGSLYLTFLVMIMAGVSFVFVLASMMAFGVAIKQRKAESPPARFSVKMFIYGFYGLMIVIPLLVLAVSRFAGILLFGFEAVLFYYSWKLGGKGLAQSAQADE